MKTNIYSYNAPLLTHLSALHFFSLKITIYIRLCLKVTGTPQPSSL